MHKRLRRVPRQSLLALQERVWIGNVRELENVLTRAAVLSQGDVLLEEHLREAAEATGDSAAISLPSRAPARPATELAGPALDGPAALDGIASLEDLERAHVAASTRSPAGTRVAPVEALGISRPTLDRKLRKYGLDH